MHLLRYRFNYSADTIDQLTRWELDVEMAMIASDIEKENLKHSQHN
jgi:hypothetical protein